MNKLALAAALAAIVSTPVFAAGQHQIGAGWLHINPQEESEPMKTTLADGRVIVSQGTHSSLSNENTLGLTYTYIADDNVSIQFVGGVPPKFELSGEGSSTLGQLDSFSKLATARQWSPTILGIYTFGTPAQKLRPYIGIGVTYTKFTDIKLDRGFEASASQRGTGLLYAGATGGRNMQTDAQAGVFNPSSPNFNAGLASAAAQVSAIPIGVRAEADDAIDPTLVLGLDYKISDNWYAQLSASYLPLETTATIYVDTPNGNLASADAKMDINPIVGYLGVGYRF